ncbi:Crp/Fnr family transcriptional regulator [Aurantibacter sp.]|uniref:Crp/Fnr family transcriptional regulator n=1 Tax=Aurantibacter sp. TaxID=2807103 RepID=UPI003262F238
MNNLVTYIKSRIAITQEELNLIERYFICEEMEAQTTLLEAGKTERYIYFLSSGIVRGYQNSNGKLIIEHLVDQHNFFTSLESFINDAPSPDYFETLTPSKLLKISKPDLELLRNYSPTWNTLIETITNEHLQCKMERVRDFQTLTAKERYLKFVKENPNLALNVSIENIASFLGMEPQSLSRIRKQITF